MSRPKYIIRFDEEKLRDRGDKYLIGVMMNKEGKVTLFTPRSYGYSYGYATVGSLKSAVSGSYFGSSSESEDTTMYVYSLLDGRLAPLAEGLL